MESTKSVTGRLLRTIHKTFIVRYLSGFGNCYRKTSSARHLKDPSQSTIFPFASAIVMHPVPGFAMHPVPGFAMHPVPGFAMHPVPGFTSPCIPSQGLLRHASRPRVRHASRPRVRHASRGRMVGKRAWVRGWAFNNTRRPSPSQFSCRLHAVLSSVSGSTLGFPRISVRYCSRPMVAKWQSYIIVIQPCPQMLTWVKTKRPAVPCLEASRTSPYTPPGEEGREGRVDNMWHRLLTPVSRAVAHLARSSLSIT